MSYRGIARGNVIELEEPLPFDDGQAVSVDVRAQRSPGADLLRALRAGPPVSSEDMEELMQIIRASKQPPGKPVEF